MSSDMCLNRAKVRSFYYIAYGQNRQYLILGNVDIQSGQTHDTKLGRIKHQMEAGAG